MDQFIRYVREYLSVIEGCHSLSALELLRGAARVVPALYAASFDLPNRGPATSEAPVSEHIRSPMPALSQILGPWDVYSEVFDPCKETEAIKQSLSDDLADIYVDLKAVSTPLRVAPSTMEFGIGDSRLPAIAGTTLWTP